MSCSKPATVDLLSRRASWKRAVRTGYDQGLGVAAGVGVGVEIGVGLGVGVGVGVGVAEEVGVGVGVAVGVGVGLGVGFGVGVDATTCLTGGASAGGCVLVGDSSPDASTSVASPAPIARGTPNRTTVGTPRSGHSPVLCDDRR